MGAELMLARCAIYPKFIPEGTLSREAFIELSSAEKDADNLYQCAISVGSIHLLDTVEKIHGYGCRTAEGTNRRLREKLEVRGEAFDPNTQQSYYLGYYEIDGNVVIGLGASGCTYTVVCVEEFGEKAHSEIRVQQLPPDTRKQFLARRLEAQIELGRLLFGPYRHVCACDADKADWLHSIELPEYH